MSGKIRRAVSTAADRARNRLGIDEAPDYQGPTTRDAAKGAKITHPAQQDEVATEFDETLYYGDPTKDIPEEMSGVVQIKTASEAAAERAYDAALADPTSVLTEPVRQGDGSYSGSAEQDTLTDAEQLLAKNLVARNHREAQQRVDRLKSTLSGVEGAGTIGQWGPGGIIIGGDPEAYPDLSQVTGSLDEEIARAKAFQERARQAAGIEMPSSQRSIGPLDVDPEDIAQRREALARFHAEQSEAGDDD